MRGSRVRVHLISDARSVPPTPLIITIISVQAHEEDEADQIADGGVGGVRQYPSVR